MELDLAKLALDGMRLDLGGARSLSLGPSGPATGRLQTGPEEIRIEAQGPNPIILRELSWPIGNGRLDSSGETVTTGTELELTVLRKRESGWLIGKIGVAQLNTEGLRLELPALGEQPLIATDLQARGLGVAMQEQGLAVIVEELTVGRLEMRIGQLDVVLHALRVTGLRVRSDPNSGLLVEADAVTADSTALDAGDLSRLLTREASTDEAPDEPAPRAWSLELLDQLRGKVDVDLTADASLPLIGRRRATHHFRIPISNGTLNYRRLEKSLSALEDAVLDFAVRGGKLVLEKDIPLVPFDRKTLVAWTLDAAERKLAEKHTVRLRRLFRFELPRGAAGAEVDPVDDEQTSVELRELLFDNIEVHLDLAGPGRLELPGGGSVRAGSHKEAAIESLRVRGAVRYQTAASSAEQTTLQLETKRLCFGLDGVAIGDHSLTSSEVRVGAVAPSTLGFVGARPRSLSTVLRDTVIRGLRFGRRS